MCTVEELSCVDMLRDVDRETLTRKMTNRQIFVESHSKAKTVHHQGDICKTLDFVLSGKLIAYALFDNGSAVTMFEFTKGSVIGANLLFGDKQAYPLNIYATTDCELVRISSDAVLELLHGYSFTLKFVKAISQNSQGMNTKLTMMTQKTLRENILDYLKQQRALQQSAAITLPISKKELADRLGVQRPSLFREFKRLQDERVIAVNNRCISFLEDD